MTLLDRLLKNSVEVEGPLETPCLIWTGANNGYGVVWWKGKYIATHRAAFECANGPIEKGFWILHKCDNPLCIRDTHLFAGTGRDNAIDMHNKGRGFIPRGELQGQSKLTENEIREIRAFLNTGLYSQQWLADNYGVSRSLIGLIGQRKRWKGVR